MVWHFHFLEFSTSSCLFLQSKSGTFYLPLNIFFFPAASAASKYDGLEDLDVGSKFKMFEGGADPDRGPASDRYGIMEKLKRLEEGEELDDLLAEMDEELPSPDEDEEEVGMSAVQKRVKS